MINIKNYDQVIYVNVNTGSDDYIDDESGGVDKPYKSIKNALSKASGSNVLIYLDKGVYETETMLTLSKSKTIITIYGKCNDTIILLKSCPVASRFNGDLNVYNVIFKPDDNYSDDTRALSYSVDSLNVNFYNCVFTKSDNKKYPTQAVIFTTTNASTYTNKNLYNCDQNKE